MCAVNSLEESSEGIPHAGVYTGAVKSLAVLGRSYSCQPVQNFAKFSCILVRLILKIHYSSRLLYRKLKLLFLGDLALPQVRQG